MTTVPESVRDRLESLPHVVGTAVGKKRVDGRKTDETCIVVFVDRKIPETELADGEIVPETVDCDGETLSTDVQQVGEISAQAIPAVDRQSERTGRQRPAPPGVSIAHPSISAGTLGSPVLETEGGKRVVLTNAHVAAPIGEATAGDPVLQPGPDDGGGEGDEIGSLSEWSEISPDGTNTTDSALVEVDPDDVDGEILGVGELVGFGEPDLDGDDEYVKSGRTTGVTTGELRGRDARIEVGGFFARPVAFEGVDLFGPMSAGGDSGSLIGTEEGDGIRATNLLFAGSDEATIGIPMDAVEAEHGELSVLGAGEGNGNRGDEDEDDDLSEPGDPGEPTGGFEGRLRDRLEELYGTVGDEDGAFRVEAWPLSVLVVPGEEPEVAAERARRTDADVDVIVIAVPEGTEGEIPSVPAGVAVVTVDL